MEEKITKEVAEAEVARLVDFYEVAPEGEDWETARARLVRATSRGALALEEETAQIRLRLVQPIELVEGKGKIAELVFHEPTAGDLKVLDRYGDREQMAKTIHLVSKMTGQPIGVVERLAARDLGNVGAIAQLFF